MVDCYQQRLTNHRLGTDERATYSEIARWILVSALFVGLILAYAWSHNEILNIHYRMEQLRRENLDLRELNTALRAEHSSLSNPEVIDRQARNLGLIRPNRTEVRILDSEFSPDSLSNNLVAQSTLEKNTLHE